LSGGRRAAPRDRTGAVSADRAHGAHDPRAVGVHRERSGIAARRGARADRRHAARGGSRRVLAASGRWERRIGERRRRRARGFARTRPRRRAAARAAGTAVRAARRRARRAQEQPDADRGVRLGVSGGRRRARVHAPAALDAARGRRRRSARRCDARNLVSPCGARRRSVAVRRIRLAAAGGDGVRRSGARGARRRIAGSRRRRDRMDRRSAGRAGVVCCAAHAARRRRTAIGAREARARSRRDLLLGSLHRANALGAARDGVVQEDDRLMRVLLVTRANAAAKPGGDAVVAERAAEALRGLGVEADFVASDEPDARGYDVAHVFGIFDPHVARAQFAAVRRAGVPLVLSPIWWDRSGFFAISPRVERILTERDPRRIDSALARLRADEPRIVRRPGRGAERRLREQAELMRACDVAVTASEVEAFVCATQLRAQHVPYVVARYGVDSEYFDVPRSAVRSGVVCVGRIEPLKNQALLLHALRDVDADVTLVGRAYEDAYIALCRRRANRRTRFVERLARAELQ